MYPVSTAASVLTESAKDRDEPGQSIQQHLDLIKILKKSPLKAPDNSYEQCPNQGQQSVTDKIMSSEGKATGLENSPNECPEMSISSIDVLRTPTKTEQAAIDRENLIETAIASAAASQAKAKLSEWEMVPSPESVVKMLGDDLPHNSVTSIEMMKTPTKQELSDKQEEKLINVAVMAATAKLDVDDSGWEIIQTPDKHEEALVYEAIRKQSVKVRRKLAMKIAITMMESGYTKLLDHIMNSATHQPTFPGITGKVLENVILIVAEIVNEFLKQKGIKNNKIDKYSKMNRFGRLKLA